MNGARVLKLTENVLDLKSPLYESQREIGGNYVLRQSSS